VLDPLGRRVGKKYNDVLERGWLWGSQHGPVAELAADGVTLAARFVYGTRSWVPDYMVIPAGQSNDGTYRIISDQLGSVRLVVDISDGDVKQRMDYDSFGRVIEATSFGYDFQPFGFAGGLYDRDTGLMQFGAREYDPEVGRWLTKDPALLGDGTNLYSYVHQDPINSIDPTGAAAFPVVLVGIETFLLVFLADNQDAATGAAIGAAVGLPVGAAVGALGSLAGQWIGGALVRSAGGSCSTAGLRVRSGIRAGAADDAAFKARTINPRPMPVGGNRLNHIFGQARHNLGPVVQKFGTQHGAFEAIQNAKQAAANSGRISGVFETVVHVGGFDVTVRGRVVGGAAHIGTAFIP
jgi:RHS repeat-associated protein